MNIVKDIVLWTYEAGGVSIAMCLLIGWLFWVFGPPQISAYSRKLFRRMMRVCKYRDITLILSYRQRRIISGNIKRKKLRWKRKHKARVIWIHGLCAKVVIWAYRWQYEAELQKSHNVLCYEMRIRHRILREADYPFRRSVYRL